VLLVPNGTTLDVPLRRERVTIGRRADNDVCLPNLAVSGEHAVVVTILTDSFLEDLGSTNGTLVNGKPIAKHFLRDGRGATEGRRVDPTKPRRRRQSDLAGARRWRRPGRAAAQVLVGQQGRTGRAADPRPDDDRTRRGAARGDRAL